jgi:hypothetical protein
MSPNGLQTAQLTTNSGDCLLTSMSRTPNVEYDLGRND